MLSGILFKQKIKILNFQLIQKDALLPFSKFNANIVIGAIAIFGYNRLDQLYIFENISKNELGIYFSILKLFDIVNLVIIASINAKLSILANKKSFDKSYVEERKIMTIGLLLIFLVVVCAPWYLKIMFGDTPDDYRFIYIVSLSSAISLIGSVKGPWVAKLNRYRVNTIFTMIGFSLSVIYLYFYRPTTLAATCFSVLIGQGFVNLLGPLTLSAERTYLKKLFFFKGQ